MSRKKSELFRKYPKLTIAALIVMSLMGLVGFLAAVVVPQFKAIFRDFGAGLPWLTRFYMDHWIVIAIVAGQLLLLQVVSGGIAIYSRDRLTTQISLWLGIGCVVSPLVGLSALYLPIIQLGRVI